MAVIKYKKDGVWYTVAGTSSGFDEDRVTELVEEILNNKNKLFAEMDSIIGISETTELESMDLVIGR